MIGQLIAMFIIGMGVMFCVCAILFLKYIEPMYHEDDSDFYPYDTAELVRKMRGLIVIEEVE